MNEHLVSLLESLGNRETYLQLGLIITSLVVAYVLARLLRNQIAVFRDRPDDNVRNPLRLVLYKLGDLLFPVIWVLILKLERDLIPGLDRDSWMLMAAITLVLVYGYIKGVSILVNNPVVGKALLVVGIPLLVLESSDALHYLTSVLDSIAIEIGNIRITLLGVLRVTIFGSLVFWLGRVSNSAGQTVIREQAKLDYRTREVVAKLFEIGVFVVASLVLLQIVGINITALAVFGGALGVGLGFGLQAIASNFISGLIILLDRSLAVGDFIQLEDGRSGYVTALNMRSTMIETFEGKDIVVPNELFITNTFVNWTRKNKKQRYRVDFSVAYDTDIRRLVDVIKEAVATHPQVLSGEAYPIEERPDCEIDSFGDSGVNMFVEFWIDTIDDGENRVGGDLLLIIYETMREHGFSFPFPQREVRILNEGQGRNQPA